MLTTKLQFKIKGIEELTEFTKLFAKCLETNDIVCLTGDLGAGKTTFTRVLVKELGFNDFVSSPTFNILHEYCDKQCVEGSSNQIDIVYHFDTYRLETTESFQASALDSYFGEGLCLIEWGELIRDILPENTIYLAISYKQDLANNIDNGERELSLSVQEDFISRNQTKWQELCCFCTDRDDLIKTRVRGVDDEIFGN